MLLAFAFHRDPRQEANRRFLEVVQARGPAMPIYAVMELLGQLSFNLSPCHRSASANGLFGYKIAMA